MGAATGILALAAVAVPWLLRLAIRQLNPEVWQNPAGPLLGLCAVAASMALARLAACLLGCLVAWSCLLVVDEATQARPGPIRLAAAASRAAIRTSPRLLRPALITLLGGSLALGPVAMAGAAARPDTVPTSGSMAPLPSAQWQGLPDPGWVPPRPAPAPRRQPDVSLVAAAPTRHAGSVGAGTDRGTIVVRRGDTLWSIAARHLGPSATDVEIARAWPAWWRANRDRIGDDPDLIKPGQLLQVPAASSLGAAS